MYFDAEEIFDIARSRFAYFYFFGSSCARYMGEIRVRRRYWSMLTLDILVQSEGTLRSDCDSLSSGRCSYLFMPSVPASFSVECNRESTGCLEAKQYESRKCKMPSRKVSR